AQGARGDLEESVQPLDGRRTLSRPDCHLALQRLRLSLESCDENVLFTGEALVERCQRNSCLIRNISLPDVVEPTGLRQVDGYIQDAVASFLETHAAQHTESCSTLQESRAIRARSRSSYLMTLPLALSGN